MTTLLECARCQAGLSQRDVRCPACGAPTGRGDDGFESSSLEAPTGNRYLIDNPYAVLGAVFLALAVFGIPLIWMCRAWSPAVKTILTLATLAYTALLLWLFWLVMMWVWGRLHAEGVL